MITTRVDPESIEITLTVKGSEIRRLLYCLDRTTQYGATTRDKILEQVSKHGLNYYSFEQCYEERRESDG